MADQLIDQRQRVTCWGLQQIAHQRQRDAGGPHFADQNTGLDLGRVVEAVPVGWVDIGGYQHPSAA
ncbi:hypothetical protein G7085_11765 [Tessaracoccus sp. HDW20]|uniref:hypothetical protein n=1 Tax=Tessaracoccus coleopterorum TaxID=2714950 RepID=UPI0018D431A1|nr:hypothetical protein [Tessaracoccus coleopterorum]NHB85062.1 hypothetical protein [Tessaracoccus coleopterorum]